MDELDPVPASGPLAIEPRQRRGSRRRPLEALVRMVHPPLVGTPSSLRSPAGTGVTINVSEGGLRIAIDCALEAGSICVLVVSEPDAPEQLVRARVVWARVVEDGCIAGLQRLGLH